MPFIGKQSTSNSQITNYTTTVGSGGQTNFTVVIEGGDETHVYLNGVLLKETTDYTVSSTQVSLVSAAVENDIVEIKVFRSFALVDAVKATGGIFTGDVTVPNLTLSSNVIKASDGGSTITLDTSDNVAIAGNVKVGGNVIKASDGGSTITLDTSDNVTVAGDLKVSNVKHASSGSNNLALASDGTTTTTLSSTSVVPASVGGTWIKLEEKTASGDTTIEMGSSTLLSSSYDLYCIKFVNLSVSASGSNLYGRFNVGGILSGSSYRYSTSTWRSDVGAILHNQGHSGTSFYMGYAINNTAEVSNDCHATGFVYLPQPYTTTKLKQAFGTCAISEDENYRVSHTNFVASYNTSASVTTALTEFQFLLSGSGNISAGKFVLYGIKD